MNKAGPPAEQRPPALAGTWYPEAPAELEARIDELIAAAPRPPIEAGESRPMGLVAPHAGLVYSGSAAAATYRAALFGPPPERIVLLGPAHRRPVRGLALPAPSLRAFGTPIGALPVDQAAASRLRGLAIGAGDPSAHDPEHALEMQLIFLARLWPGTPILPILTGSLDSPRVFEEAAAALIGELRSGDLVVVSSDFTHYGRRFGYTPFGVEPDHRLEAQQERARAAVLSADRREFEAHLEQTQDTICGRDSIRLLLELAPAQARWSSCGFDDSARVSGDRSHIVCYAGMLVSGSAGWGS